MGIAFFINQQQLFD